MTKQPWMKWRPDAWSGEKLLKLCGRQARSLWIDLIGIMHEAEPYGHLMVNGRPATTKELSQMLGDRPADIERWIAELTHAGVCSVEGGVIVCRRMVRDHAKMVRDKGNGGKGGNPKLKPKENADDNAGVNPPLKARDERLETRDEKEDSDADASAPGAPDPLPLADPVKVMFDHGVALLMQAGKSRDNAGSIIGRWRKAHGVPAVIDALHRAHAEQASNPVAFIEGIFRNPTKGHANGKQQPRRTGAEGFVEVARELWEREHGMGNA